MSLLLRIGITLFGVGAALFFAAFAVAVATGFSISAAWAVPGIACMALAAICVWADVIREVWS